jgi:hypothetical protein
MVATGYNIVSSDQVQAGDVYKFIPAMDSTPALYGDVLQVLAGRNLVQVQWWDDNRTAWTYIKPPAGQVAFGRKNGVNR